MPQSALTCGMGQLESSFGAPLFVSLFTLVRPTARAALAAKQTQRMLRAVEETEDRIGGTLEHIPLRHGHIQQQRSSFRTRLG